MGLLRILLLLCSLVAAAWAQVTVPSGPYVQNLTSHGATVLWVRDWAVVPLPAQPGTVLPAPKPRRVPGFQVNRKTISGLKPATFYRFDIPGAGPVSFKTPPDKPEDFIFVVYGDTRTRHDVHRRVVEKIAAAKPEFVVHDGDLVADGENPATWPVFFDISRELLRTTPFFPALGNHERGSPFWYQLFDKTAGYYSFDWGEAHFIMMNSDAGHAPLSEGAPAYWKKQLEWLESDLEKNRNADFVFVTLHHPPFTAMSRRKAESAKIASLVLPIFRKYEVNAVFSGHDHNYQHHVDSGTHYVVTGGGGAPLYEVNAPIPGHTLKAESTENFVVVEVLGRSVRMEARALDGRTLDRFEIPARKAALSGAGKK